MFLASPVPFLNLKRAPVGRTVNTPGVLFVAFSVTNCVFVLVLGEEDLYE